MKRHPDVRNDGECEGPAFELQNLLEEQVRRAEMRRVAPHLPNRFPLRMAGEAYARVS